MGLIDANELMKLIPSEEMVSKYAVANAPTVEAIPIEWLKELQTKYLEAKCFMSVCVVNEIRNLWGKENEIDR